MKKLLFLVAVALCLSSTALSQEVRSVIERNNQTWEKAMLDNDVNTIIDMYAEDVISLPSYSPMMKGKSELKEHMEKEMSSGNKFTNVEFNTIEVKEEGDLAVEIGTYNMSMQMGNGEEWTDTGKYITVWEKQGNDWKVVIETWNTDSNPWEQMENKDRPEETQE